MDERATWGESRKLIGDDFGSGNVVGIVVTESEGSRWEFWETEHRYRRSPRHEAARENPAWGGPDAGPLEDHVWHEFVDWHVGVDGSGRRWLFVELPAGGGRVRAPEPSLPIGAGHVCVMCSW